jgi:hypothetical protein
METIQDDGKTKRYRELADAIHAFCVRALGPDAKREELEALPELIDRWRGILNNELYVSEPGNAGISSPPYTASEIERMKRAIAEHEAVYGPLSLR